MKYLVIGAGGTGGSIGAFMTEAYKDVVLIDRGQHLETMQRQGLYMKTTRKGDYIVYPIRALAMEDYDEQPEVIFVCVKGYSIDSIIPFIKRIAGPSTVVVPILNVYGTGSKMQAMLPDLLVTDGCVYVAAEIEKPGTILQTGDIFRIVFGLRNPGDEQLLLDNIVTDLKDSGIECILSSDIKRDALQKFSYVSPMAACGAYYDVDAGGVQHPGKARETFIALMNEIEVLARAMGIDFEVDIVATNLKILDSLLPTASTSMQRDLRLGTESEIDGLIFEVVRLADQYGVAVPNYKMIAASFNFAS